MRAIGAADWDELQARAHADEAGLIGDVLRFCDFRFYKAPDRLIDSSKGPEWTDWCVGATTSIVDSACGYAGLTKAPPGFEVVTAEFKINLMRPALGERFLAIGRVQSAGRLLTVCTGEVRAFADSGDGYKVIALMQATIVNVQR